MELVIGGWPWCGQAVASATALSTRYIVFPIIVPLATLSVQYEPFRE